MAIHQNNQHQTHFLAVDDFGTIALDALADADRLHRVVRFWLTDMDDLPHATTANLVHYGVAPAMVLYTGTVTDEDGDVISQHYALTEPALVTAIWDELRTEYGPMSIRPATLEALGDALAYSGSTLELETI